MPRRRAPGEATDADRPDPAMTNGAAFFRLFLGLVFFAAGALLAFLLVTAGAATLLWYVRNR